MLLEMVQQCSNKIMFILLLHVVLQRKTSGVVTGAENDSVDY